MTVWIRTPLNILATAFVASLVYVSEVAILNKAVGFGEPLWLGFVLQIALHVIYSLVALLVFILPIHIFSVKKLTAASSAMAISCMAVFAVLVLVYTQFVAGVGGAWLLAVLPCVSGTLCFYMIERKLDWQRHD